MIENNPKQLIMLPNDAKSKMYVIDKLDTDFVMAKNKGNFRCNKHHHKVTYSEIYAFDLQTRLL